MYVGEGKISIQNKTRGLVEYSKTMPPVENEAEFQGFVRIP